MLDDDGTINSTHMFSCAAHVSRLTAGPAVKRRQGFAGHHMVLEVSERFGMDAQVTRVQL